METDLDPQDAASHEPRHDLGILLVHGIGHQAPGATLHDWSRAIVEYLNHRATTDAPHVEVVRATITNELDDTPAHAAAQVGPEKTTWLLAESHWASQFRDPTFRDMLDWSVARLPFAAAMHTADRLHADVAGCFDPDVSTIRSLIRLVVDLVAHLLLICIAPFGVAILAITLVVALIPIDALRRPFLAIRNVVTSMLGDCHALVDDPITEAAIRTRVARDLEWVAARSDKVVVIAHSQGAAVTFLTLRRHTPPNVHRVVTIGSGLRKLLALRHLRHDRQRRERAAASFGVSIGAIIFATSIVRGEADLLALFLALGLLLLLGVSFLKQENDVLDFENWLRHDSESSPQWLDVYASADPVSNGPALSGTRKNDIDRYRSVKVTNEGSMLRDHTTYWSNADDVLPLVTDLLLHPNRAVTELAASHDGRSLASARRRARIWLRRFIDWTFGLGAALLLLVEPPHVDIALHKTASLQPIGLRFDVGPISEDVLRFWMQMLATWAVARVALASLAMTHREERRELDEKKHKRYWYLTGIACAGSAATGASAIVAALNLKGLDDFLASLTTFVVVFIDLSIVNALAAWPRRQTSLNPPPSSPTEAPPRSDEGTH